MQQRATHPLSTGGFHRPGWLPPRGSQGLTSTTPAPLVCLLHVYTIYNYNELISPKTARRGSHLERSGPPKSCRSKDHVSCRADAPCVTPALATALDESQLEPHIHRASRGTTRPPVEEASGSSKRPLSSPARRLTTSHTHTTVRSALGHCQRLPSFPRLLLPHRSNTVFATQPPPPSITNTLITLTYLWAT
ncbi:hypothetical protein E2C01_031072 [Portunus trituberculatus]|uniref:Uncharacterized protein n=1 Tax=Portunus trituberculatus TaxID=210409 RepID=A0A5B7EVW4_PORTR|nr:hypothetical protein [Portunus trituberculatus]